MSGASVRQCDWTECEMGVASLIFTPITVKSIQNNWSEECSKQVSLLAVPSKPKPQNGDQMFACFSPRDWKWAWKYSIPFRWIPFVRHHWSDFLTRSAAQGFIYCTLKYFHTGSADQNFICCTLNLLLCNVVCYLVCFFQINIDMKCFYSTYGKARGLLKKRDTHPYRKDTWIAHVLMDQ